MDINKIALYLKNSIGIKEVSADTFQIVTSALLPNKKPIVLYLEKKNNAWLLNDKQTIIKFMNTMYELRANDVKSCINNVVKINKFSINNATIYTEITDEKNLVFRIFDFVMCINQLVNMYAFFDKPV